MAEELTAGAVSPDRVAGSAKALLVVDDDCVCVEASLGACRMLGVTRHELVGRTIAELLEPESQERFAHVWLAFRDAGGHAEPFALEAPAAVVEVAATVTSQVLPSRHLITLDRPSDLDPQAGQGASRPRRERRFASRGEAAPPSADRRLPTAREREVLQLLAQGRTDIKIADLLELSPATVQTHVRNAKAKLGARTRAQAVAIALQRGMIGAN